MMKKVDYCTHWELEYNYNKLKLDMNICNDYRTEELMEKYPNGVEIIHDKVDANVGYYIGEHKLIVDKLIEIKEDWIKKLEYQLSEFKDQFILPERKVNDK